MPSKEENPGLLSKVVKFVRNPTTNWADLDQQETDRESSYSKQILKEMIERKRRNDFVRKREFDMLRKMRRSEIMSGQDPGARPSFFQSSMPSKPDDRATTLKKIDEIEAQMSMQWWKTKHGTQAGGVSGFPVSSHMPPDAMRGPAAAGPTPAATSYSRTAPQPLPGDPAGPNTAEAPLMESVIPDPTTQAMGLVPARPVPPPPPPPARPAAAAASAAPAPFVAPIPRTPVPQ